RQQRTATMDIMIGYHKLRGAYTPVSSRYRLRATPHGFEDGGHPRDRPGDEQCCQPGGNPHGLMPVDGDVPMHGFARLL
ncbi:unnamed protein product, partial [Sphagnum balticum]